MVFHRSQNVQQAITDINELVVDSVYVPLWLGRQNNSSVYSDTVNSKIKILH
jgi:hypothetical protein